VSFAREKYVRPEYKTKAPSFVVMWDLETSNLSPKFGYMLCAGWKAWRGGKPCPCHGDYRVHIISIRDHWRWHACAEAKCRTKKHVTGQITDDRYVTQGMSDILRQADAHVTWNGKRYDWRWVQTRRWGYGWDLLPAGIPHIDIMYTARSQMAGGASLKMVSSTDPTLDADSQKTPVSGPEWVRAISGDATSQTYVEKHCIRDVKALEHEYERMQSQVWMHPRLHDDRGACKFCGGVLKKQKTRKTALANPTIQYQCNDCGKYQSMAQKKAKVA